MALPRIPKRKKDTHKGDYGRVLIVAGSSGMMGAAIMASQAALRAGAGLVTLVVPESLVNVASALQLCAVVKGVNETEERSLASSASAQILEMRADSLVIGPGLGTHPETAHCVAQLVENVQVPFVLDADGLNAFADAPGRLTLGESPRVLTPHPGELGRILELPKEDIQENRKGFAQEAARRFWAVCILKGHRSIITDGDQTFLNRTGNPGMATGGSGDVLSGIIGTFLSQKFSTIDAARLGTHIHGLAGDIAAQSKGEISLLATDVIDTLPDAFKKWMK